MQFKTFNLTLSLVNVKSSLALEAKTGDTKRQALTKSECEAHYPVNFL
jgi:hypothetical protein